MQRFRPLQDCRLYTFVDAAYLHGRDPFEICRQLCDGGSDLIQLRAKNWTGDEIQRVAERLAPIAAAANVWLVINDHPEIARQVGAPICHLGQEDFFDAGHAHMRELSAQFSNLQFGLSTHSPTQAKRAISADPAYIAIGPIFATGTKPTAKPVTLEYVRWAAAHVTIPWFAIGGINLQNIDEVLAAGATRVCVVSAILNARDIAAECVKYRLKLTQNSSR